MQSDGTAGVTEVDDEVYTRDIEGIEATVVKRCCGYFGVASYPTVSYGRQTRNMRGKYSSSSMRIVLNRPWLGTLIHEAAHHVTWVKYHEHGHCPRFKWVLQQLLDMYAF